MGERVMSKKTYPLKCSICGENIQVEHGSWMEGHNAQPINDGRCCSLCNDSVVLPTRMARLGLLKKSSPPSRD